MAQNFTWPAGFATATNPSTGFTGSAAPTQATETAGVDGGGILRALSTDTSGHLNVNATITAGLANPLPTTDKADGSVSGGTAGTASMLSGGLFNTVLPTITNGQQAAIQLDSSARLILAPLTNSSIVKSQLQDNAGNALTSTAGALDVNLKTSSITLAISGTVTANAGTNLNTSLLALDTSVNGILLSQGSTTSGQKGSLIQGAVTTAAPTYSTSQTSPLSLTTAGALRVDASGSTQPISGTVAVTQSTSPWVTNVSQFGGSAVVTGTGASGSGIPRVTVANDSNILATQSGTWSVTATQTTAANLKTSSNANDGSGNALTSHAVNSNRGADDFSLGYTNSEFVRNDYTSVNVTTSAYVQLIASTANEYQEFEIFDSSGQTLEIAFGAAASEVNKFLVYPGGNGRIKRNVPASTRISIKAVSATANAGEIDINLYG